MTATTNILTPGKLLAAIYTNPKARFQLTFPVYRVSGRGTATHVEWYQVISSVQLKVILEMMSDLQVLLGVTVSVFRCDIGQRVL